MIGGLILGGYGGLTKFSEYKFKGNHEFYIFELSILNFNIPMVTVELFMFMSFLKPLFSTFCTLDLAGYLMHIKFYPFSCHLAGPGTYKLTPLFSTSRRVPINLHPFFVHLAGYL